MFAAPNTSAIMSSVPARRRGVASGMRATFQNSGTALSIGVFVSLMIAGLSTRLPDAMSGGLIEQGIPPAVAHEVGATPPVATLFSAILGVNPLGHLLAPTGALAALPADNQQVITGSEFFPHLIAEPFAHGLAIVFTVSAILAALAALASLMRGSSRSVDVT
jgi:hypothetical protein